MRILPAFLAALLALASPAFAGTINQPETILLLSVDCHLPIAVAGLCSAVLLLALTGLINRTRAKASYDQGASHSRSNFPNSFQARIDSLYVLVTPGSSIPACRLSHICLSRYSLAVLRFLVSPGACSAVWHRDCCDNIRPRGVDAFVRRGDSIHVSYPGHRSAFANLFLLDVYRDNAFRIPGIVLGKGHGMSPGVFCGIAFALPCGCKPQAMPCLRETLAIYASGPFRKSLRAAVSCRRVAAPFLRDAWPPSHQRVCHDQPLSSVLLDQLMVSGGGV
jgi:hypothetical protein